MPIRRTAELLMVMLVTLPACSTSRYYAESERGLNTEHYYSVLDHIAVYYPSGIALNFKGYIVGFEQSMEPVNADRDELTLHTDVTAYGRTIGRLLTRIRETMPFVSHITHYQGRQFGAGNCALFNLYNNHAEQSLIDDCDGAVEHPGDGVYTPRAAFASSWLALDALKRRLAEDVASGDYTHLVVAMMGLDTPEEEAVRNYNSLAWSIRRSGGERFRPLFIGISWPSFYSGRWFDPLWEILSYAPIADRADLLGLTWLGVLLNDVVMPLQDRIRISLIVHSFGARAASMGICVGPAILRYAGQQPYQLRPGGVDDFIGLSPAFSLMRFHSDKNLFYENIYYPDFCPKVARFTFTASDADRAYATVVWADMVGDYDYRAKYCGYRHRVRVRCATVDADGHMDDYSLAAKINYMDTTALMAYGVPGTDGRAHSDIYRPAVGRFLWTVLRMPVVQ